tara:strand:+ start:29 stop:1027 length:999 start_codon:yes stop_codon:yes gene_type:complete
MTFLSLDSKASRILIKFLKTNSFTYLGVRYKLQYLSPLLLRDLKFVYPKPFSSVYTYPDEEESPGLPFCTFQLNNVSPNNKRVDMQVLVDGFNLRGEGVFDYRWSNSGRLLHWCTKLENTSANRKLLREKINQINEKVDMGVDMNFIKSSTMKTLKNYFAQCLLANSAKQADLTHKLFPDNDVVCSMVMYKEYPLLHVALFPYQCYSLCLDVGNTQMLGKLKRGVVSEYLQNGFRTFKPFNSTTSIRVHRMQLDIGNFGDVVLKRNTTEAFEHMLHKQSSHIIQCHVGESLCENSNVRISEVASFNNRENEQESLLVEQTTGDISLNIWNFL